jgi:hypothetical protein
MKLDAQIVKENRERLDVRFRDFAMDTYIDKPTPEIMILSTFELLYLLKLIRKERNDMYHHLHTFHRASVAGSNEFKEVEKTSGQDYIYYTKKAFVVENIIRSRLGYVPKRITENFLARYLENIRSDKKEPMNIRTERQKKLNKG